MDISHKNIEDIQEQNHSEDLNDETELLIVDHNANSSITSVTDKENYPLAKTIDKFTVLLQNPTQITDKRLFKFNCIIIIMIVFLSVIDFVSFVGYKTTLL